MPDYNNTIVDTSNIITNSQSYSNFEYRSTLTIPYQNRSQQLVSYLIVMMNPSKANQTTSDQTVNKVIDYFSSDPLINSINVCNLFPFYKTDSTQLGSLIDSISNTDYHNTIIQNRSAINSKLASVSKVFLGYGDCPASCNSVLFYNEVIQLLTSIKNVSPNLPICAFDLNDTKFTKYNNPRHPARYTAINGELPILINIDHKLS